MNLLVRSYSLFLLFLASSSAFALEVHQGDHFAGISVFSFLKQKVYNFEDELCGQKTILNSPDHQTFIAIGAYLYDISFTKIYNDPTTGKAGLIVSATYRDDKFQTEMTQDLGGCVLKD